MAAHVRRSMGLLALLASAGCATQAHYKAAAPEVSKNCVGDLREIEARPLRMLGAEEAPYTLEFANVSRCWRPADATVAVPVALYRLDALTPPAEVDVTVMLSAGGTFAAAVQVLDAAYQPVKRYDFKDFTRRGSVYSLNVFLNAEGAKPAYLLLAPDDTQVGKSDTVIGAGHSTSVIPAGPVMFAYNHGFETTAVRPFLSGGRIRVTARPQRSAAFSD